MAAKVVIFGILFVVMMGMLVFSVEFFIPLSAKSDMNVCCRRALLAMELESGLTYRTEQKLKSDLEKIGFINVVVDGASYAKQGEEIRLVVEADYKYSKLEGMFIRKDCLQHMVYSKTAIARKVVN
ncbi:MAG: hypothetical protein ACOX7R_01275 [Acetivibrionales bacterium]|jgi:hypothetical protein